VHNFLSYLANRQTNKQTKSDKNITSLAEVKIVCTMQCHRFISQSTLSQIRATIIFLITPCVLLCYIRRF